MLYTLYLYYIIKFYFLKILKYYNIVAMSMSAHNRVDSDEKASGDHA